GGLSAGGEDGTEAERVVAGGGGVVGRQFMTARRVRLRGKQSDRMDGPDGQRSPPVHGSRRPTIQSREVSSPSPDPASPAHGFTECLPSRSSKSMSPKDFRTG